MIGVRIVKVFGVGLSKTGTTSLARALEILGYRVKDCLGITKYLKGDISSIDKTALESYDALTDTPIPNFYQELDKEYPGSKFILTVRDMDGWLKSCKKQFNQKLAEKRSDAANQLFLDLYGTVTFDEEKFRYGYKKFTESVLEYFKDRPGDLLVIDISKGEGWEKLCPFLNKPKQNTIFPKSNVTQIKWLDVHQIAQSIRRSVRGNKKDNSLFSLLGFKKEKGSHINSETLFNVISENLSKINAEIPIVSKNNQDIPLAKRNAWHHFWLIDYFEENNNYVINVALIEDGRPYIGIIYSSSLDILYYSAIDKGAFKAMNDEEPIALTHLKDSQKLDKELSENSNIGWQLSQLAENPDQADISFKSSKEWQTAAGHAILMNAGLYLVESANDQTLKYNKTDWLNPEITVIRK